MTDMDDNEDLDDDGTLDVQWYPLPSGLLAQAEALLGADEVARLLGPDEVRPAPPAR